jgi:predicted nucleic acid-binding protein
MIIYCDTNSLFSNPKRHKENAKAQREAAAIRRLLDYHRSGKHTMQRCNVALRELEETGNPIQRDNLRRDFLELVPVAKDEKVLGFNNLQTDPYGGFVTNPIVSDVQDEPLAELLQASGLPKRDAQHLAQAISNQADVFLTLDERHFINRRETLEKQFKIKIRRPSELLLEIEAAA